jgi:hypothetical protein
MIKSGQDVNEEFYRDLSKITKNYIETPVGEIKVISNELLPKDKKEHYGVMWGYKRNDYMIKPGIYALGNPKATSPVLVSCNYKLTFDTLRKDLNGLDCWILILETNGVNVWCASGKGIFGTEELIRRIKKTKLEALVTHKMLIIPQLGASGVSISKLKAETGFRGIFGPIRSEDIKEFINNKFKPSEGMRQVKFDFKDRAKLTPLNFVQNFKYYLFALALLLIINIVGSLAKGLEISIIKATLVQSIPALCGVIVAAVVFPLTLPLLPFKSFSLKGVTLSAIFVAIWFWTMNYLHIPITMNFIGYSLIISALITNICLSFTGSTTYTSFSGVVKETLWALPLCILFAVIGIAMMIMNIV